MKYLVIAGLLVGCGSPDVLNLRTKHGPICQDDYITVANVTIDIKSSSGALYATIPPITYTSNASSAVTLDEGALLAPAEDGSGENINLGNLDLSAIKINQLKKCGVGQNEKCTSAIIRIYTNDLGGADAGLGGFVNVTDNYAEAPVTITGTSGNVILGHTLGSANVLSSYTIPASDKKLTIGDFTGTSQLVVFPINIDFSNAGAGDYEMSIELEIALSN